MVESVSFSFTMLGTYAKIFEIFKIEIPGVFRRWRRNTRRESEIPKNSEPAKIGKIRTGYYPADT